MSEQTKRILMMSVIGLSVTLLLFGFIVGIVDKAKKKRLDEQIVKETSSNENDNIWQYTSKEESGIRNTSKSEMISHELKGEDDADESPEKNYLRVPDDATKNPTQIDMFPQKSLEETKALAHEFVTKIHAFDRKKPTEHLDSIEGLLVQGHIDYLRNSEDEKIEGMKDIEGIISRKVLKVEIKEPVAPTLIAISWDGVVISEVVDSHGQTRKDSDVYSMMFEKDSNGQFQVTDYYLNYDRKR
ncbi:hypothetical protein AB1K83_05035 [Sporosarcina sp. 179-K 3D1 HS]|uniref:hypothetical protein n=1 Tax=Sporosarcina sp. 179-K 3D1 HS TaxID=3232169 RepID=UPI00399F5E6D